MRRERNSDRQACSRRKALCQNGASKLMLEATGGVLPPRRVYPADQEVSLHSGELRVYKVLCSAHKELAVSSLVATTL